MSRYDARAINSGIYTMYKTRKNLSTNAKSIKDQVEKKENPVDASLQVLTQNLRGSSAYWSAQAGNLEAMDEELGPAPLFITLSCAEYFWPDLDEHLRKANTHIPNVDKIKINCLCCHDPVTVCIHFRQRWKAFEEQVLKNPEGPLGKVILLFVNILLLMVIKFFYYNYRLQRITLELNTKLEVRRIFI